MGEWINTINIKENNKEKNKFFLKKSQHIGHPQKKFSIHTKNLKELFPYPTSLEQKKIIDSLASHYKKDLT